VNQTLCDSLATKLYQYLNCKRLLLLVFEIWGWDVRGTDFDDFSTSYGMFFFSSHSVACHLFTAECRKKKFRRRVNEEFETYENFSISLTIRYFSCECQQPRKWVALEKYKFNTEPKKTRNDGRDGDIECIDAVAISKTAVYIQVGLDPFH
jgi:hypothetical protein